MADKDDDFYPPSWQQEHLRLYDPRNPRLSQFFQGMELITHPGDNHQFMLSRDRCGPYIGLRWRVLGPEYLGHGAVEVLVGPSLLIDPDLDGPARTLALERLRQEQERVGPSFLTDALMDSPARRLALERLRQEQEKDRQEGRQYPDRCLVPNS